MPECPECQGTTFTVVQIIKRESRLIKVDNFGDLQVEPPDYLLHRQALCLRCEDCGEKFQILDSADCWHGEDVAEKSVAQIQAMIEAWHSEGGEDGCGFPARVQNDPSVELDDDAS